MQKVVVYTMDYCPYCEMAKRLLEQRAIPYEEFKLDMEDDQAWDQLYKKSGMKTVPQIFVNGTLVGGYTDLANLDRNGGLKPLLEGKS